MYRMLYGLRQNVIREHTERKDVSAVHAQNAVTRRGRVTAFTWNYSVHKWHYIAYIQFVK